MLGLGIMRDVLLLSYYGDTIYLPYITTLFCGEHTVPFRISYKISEQQVSIEILVLSCDNMCVLSLIT